MNPESSPRESGTLFVSYLYPSFQGSGTQIRAAALVRMLAACGEVHLVVLNRYEHLPGPPDLEMEALCRSATYLRLLPRPEEGRWQDIASEVRHAALPVLDCPPGNVPAALKALYDRHHLNAFFVFRIESYFLLEGAADLFPRRWLDLDEPTSRRSRMIENLMQESSEKKIDPVQRRAHAVTRILEQKIIPRFERVFVSSPVEAAEVAPDARPGTVHVLPNIFPEHTPNPPIPVSLPREILYVGTLSYFPNHDAVRFFCSEIFPLIRRVLADTILFRIVGFGCPASLRKEVEHLPGVHLTGYQENLDDCYARASLVVVPLRAGTGTRLKILESFTRGRPVVSTPIGAEGLEVTHEKNILLAEGAEMFAQACLEVLNQPTLSARLVQGGLDLHRRTYSLDHLVRLYRKVLDSSPSPAP